MYHRIDVTSECSVDDFFQFGHVPVSPCLRRFDFVQPSGAIGSLHPFLESPAADFTEREFSDANGRIDVCVLIKVAASHVYT